MGFRLNSNLLIFPRGPVPVRCVSHTSCLNLTTPRISIIPSEQEANAQRGEATFPGPHGWEPRTEFNWNSLTLPRQECGTGSRPVGTAWEGKEDGFPLSDPAAGLSQL